MRWFIVALAVSVAGCVKTWGDTYECPKELLERSLVQLKNLEERACPVTTPQPNN